MTFVDQAVSLALRLARQTTFANESRSRLATSAGALALTVSLAWAPHVRAQEAPAAAPQPGSAALQEVTVTGTRIALAPGMDTPTPVTSVSATDLAALGPGQLIDSLSALPVFRGNTNANQSLGGQNSGGANVNMHGIGTNRTLVLLDGRRVVSSNRFGTVDVNILPNMLLKNVDTITGGASASYGTDAVAGVTNFILDTKFQGLKLKVQGGQTARNDGGNYEVGLAFGHSFIDDRLHFIASFDRNKLEPINTQASLDKRGYLAHWGVIDDPDANSGGPTYITRPHAVPTDFGNTIEFVEPPTFDKNNVQTNTAYPVLNRLVFDGSGQVANPLAFYGVGTQNSNCLCQSLPNSNLSTMYQDSTLQAGYRGLTGFTRLGFDINDHTEAYFQGIWAQNHQLVRFQSVALVTSWATQIYADNAFLPQNIADLINEYGHVDPNGGSAYYPGANSHYVKASVFLPADQNSVGGDSILDTGNKLGSYTLGLTSKVRGWTLNGYIQHGQNEQNYDAINLPRVDRLQVAMDAVRDSNGNIVCRASLPQYDPNGYWKDCAPVNLFGGEGTLTPQAAAYIMQPFKHAVADIKQDLADLSASGSLGFGLPAGDISMAVGANWRRDQLNQSTPDPSDEFPALTDGTLLSDLTGVNGLPEGDGSRGIIPQYGCGTLTSVATQTTPGVPGLRYVPTSFCGGSNSSVVQFSSQRAIQGSSHVEEGFAEFQIPLLANLPAVKRLDANVATRWADYSGSGGVWAYKGGFSWAVDDQLRIRATRSRDVRAPNLRDRFDQTLGGVGLKDNIDAFKDPTGKTPGTTVSVVGFSGGNPNLKPEKADTTTAGIVLQPHFLAGFQASVDWYKITINSAIAQLTAQVESDQCLKGDQSMCQYVHRDASNKIVQVDTLFLNLNEEDYQGIDFEVGYRKAITLFGGGPETITARAFATHYLTNKQISPSAGTINNLPTTPNTAMAILGYRNGGISGSLDGRYTSKAKLNRLYTESDVTLDNKQTIDDNIIGSQFVMDLTVGYEPEKFEGLRLYTTLTNLLDRAPAIAPATGGRTGFGFGLSGDLIGRRYVVGVEYQIK